MTIPYVGYFSVLTIIAEIATIKRFPSSHHLCSYAGLVPEVKQTGSKTAYGSIKGGRPVLRWILYQGAWNHVHHAESHLTRFYERLKQHKHQRRAHGSYSSKTHQGHLLDVGKQGRIPSGRL
ncbi:hypothetical protein AKJ65_07925 [candidate division MSBL1 archaeon SCGC-AAA259E19]|uniref:Transposase IS116/IS110/IS902 C-terminal domain-containing protein n=1 Tax=candidate division MSBL1 archaeon SCGC-AAA259E19 TaxID=1698264 RepID=A0A133UDB6_9EURY|nr:hypothetical protein AKJ65_07925 [candidate division MSBL1 archaeon SCGC-AAA259E19]